MKKLLFVCLGNICRSPAAEGIMQSLIEKEGLSSKIFCDSAGIGGWHKGELPNIRMRHQAEKRGYTLLHRARQFDSQHDFNEFDYILTMDENNFKDLQSLDKQNRFSKKLFRMTDFCLNLKAQEVPDPYDGGDEGFEWVLDLLEDACQGLLKRIKKEI